MKLPHLPLLAIGLLLLPSACFTSVYGSSSLPPRKTLACVGLGETTRSRFVLEGQDLPGPEGNPSGIIYYIKCPAKMNRELAGAPDLRAKFLECLPKYREALGTSDYGFGRDPMLVDRLTFKLGEIKIDHGRDPRKFDPAKLNRIWTIPVDVVTGPFQGIYMVVTMYDIKC